MTFTQKIQKAINTSARLHRAHIRIGLDLPYIVHPYSVAVILSQYTSDEDVICAGLLHDVLEDAEGYNFDDLSADFGERIALIVKGVTENRTYNDDGSIAETWQKRKHQYLSNLRRAEDESLLVAAADTIHNLQSLLQTYFLLGENAWGNFQASIEDKLYYYEGIESIISGRLPPGGIVSELNEALFALEDAIRRDRGRPPRPVGKGELSPL